SLQRNSSPAPLADFGLHGPCRENTHTRSQFHSFLNHLYVIEVHRRNYFNSLHAEETVDLPANHQVFVETDEVLAIEIARYDFVAARQRMARRQRDLHLLLTPTLRGALPARF